MKRVGKVWIRVFPDKPITKKPAETRMGKGKGSPEYWVAVVKPGRVLFEIGGVDEDLARESLRLAIQKLPIKAKIVVRPESAPVPAPKSATGDASGLTAEVTTEDLTKIYGLGDTFAEKLIAAGVDSFEALASADLESLREIISADGTDDQGVNEETWSKQARLLADGDYEAYDEYVEGLREADGNVVEIDDADEADEAPAPAVDAADEATSEDGDAPADEPAA